MYSLNFFGLEQGWREFWGARAQTAGNFSEKFFSVLKTWV